MGKFITWDPSINVGTLLVGVPMLLMMGKMYGDWRIMRERIQLMWNQYLVDHGMLPEQVTGRRKYDHLNG